MTASSVLCEGVIALVDEDLHAHRLALSVTRVVSVLFLPVLVQRLLPLVNVPTDGTTKLC